MSVTPCALLAPGMFLMYGMLGLWLSVRLLRHRRPEKLLAWNAFRRDVYTPEGLVWLARVRAWALAMPFVAVAIVAGVSKLCGYW